MDSVSGNGDGFLLHLNVVDLVIVVEDDLLFSRCSALTVQHDGRIRRGDPLGTIVGQVKEHRVPGYAGVLLGIPGRDVLLHIGLGAKLDHIYVTLDAQTVARYRVAAVQQAGGDGLMALGGAVHLEVPQENLQSVIRGGDSADLDGGNTVLDVHIARLSYLVAVGNPLVGDAVGVDLRGAYGDVHGIGAAHLFACHHIHKLDGDGDGDRLIDGGQLHIAFGDTKELHSLGIGEAIQLLGIQVQGCTVYGSRPVRELQILARGGDFGDSPDDLVAAGVGNISRLRIIEAIRPGALTVVELQGDGNGAVLLDNDLDFLQPGLDRNRVVVDQDVPIRKLQRSRVNFAVVGNGHALGTARHHLTGGLIHKLDTEDHRFGFLGIDGVEADVTFRPIYASPVLVDQFRKCLKRIRTFVLCIRYSIIKVPSRDFSVTVVFRRNDSRAVFGDGNTLTNRTLAFVEEADGNLLFNGLGNILLERPRTSNLNILVHDRDFAGGTPAREGISSLVCLYRGLVGEFAIYCVLVSRLQGGLTIGNRLTHRSIVSPRIGNLIVLLIIRGVISVHVCRPHGVQGGITGNSNSPLDQRRSIAMSGDHTDLIRAPTQENVGVVGQASLLCHVMLPIVLDSDRRRHSARTTVSVVLHCEGNISRSAFDVRDRNKLILRVRVGESGGLVGFHYARCILLGRDREGNGLGLFGDGLDRPFDRITINGYALLTRGYCETFRHNIDESGIGTGGQLVFGNLSSDVTNQGGQLCVDRCQIIKIIGILNFALAVHRGQSAQRFSLC